jgi:hypothetical protein
MAKKITIEMTETQARLVLESVEEWFRLRMGQYHQTADGLAFSGFHYSEEKRAEFDDRIMRRNHINLILKAVMDIAFPYSIVPRELDPDVHIASDIWSQLRWDLSEKDAIWDRTPFQMGTEPMVKVTVEDE